MITYLSDMARTLSWKCLHMTTVSALISSDISTSSRNLWATISRASSGHAWWAITVKQDFFFFFTVVIMINYLLIFWITVNSSGIIQNSLKTELGFGGLGKIQTNMGIQIWDTCTWWNINERKALFFLIVLWWLTEMLLKCIISMPINCEDKKIWKIEKVKVIHVHEHVAF